MNLIMFNPLTKSVGGEVSINSLLHFEKVTPKKVSDFIFEQLEEAIILKELLGDEQIPSERELAAIFSASRLAVREALAQLEALGLVEKRIGAKGGTFVLPITLNSHQRNKMKISENWDYMRSIFEFRTVIEPEAAFLAAQRITDEELQQLKEYMETSMEPDCSREMFRALDVKIHLGIAKASGNPYLRKAIRQIRTKINPALDLMPFSRVVRSVNNEEHNALFLALSAHDGLKAREMMSYHISKSAEAIYERVFTPNEEI